MWYQAPSRGSRSLTRYARPRSCVLGWWGVGSFRCARTPCCFFWFWWSKDFDDVLRVIWWVLWKRDTSRGTNVSHRSLRHTRLLHTSTRLSQWFSLESSWCRVPRTSAERDGTGRRDSANMRPPVRSRLSSGQPRLSTLLLPHVFCHCAVSPLVIFWLTLLTPVTICDKVRLSMEKFNGDVLSIALWFRCPVAGSNVCLLLLVAQPEISVEAAERISRSQATRNDENFFVEYTSVTNSLLCMVTPMCFSANSVVPSALVGHSGC